VKIYASSIGLLILQIGAAQSLQTPQTSQVYQSHPISVDFIARNSPAQWPVAAEIAGSVELDGDVLRVHVKTCTLSRGEHYADPENLVSIRSGISHELPGNSFEMPRRSERHLIKDIISPGERFELQPFELTIPLDDLAIERGDRLTFEIASIFLEEGRKTGGFVYAHARPRWPAWLLLSKKAEASDSVRFRAYADPAVHSVDAEIGGRISQQPEALTIAIDSCNLASSDEYPDSGRKVATIQVLIARTLEYGKLTIERTAGPYSVDQTLTPGTRLVLQPFELKLSLTEYAKHPSDRINLRVVSVTSEGRREVAYLDVPYELPAGVNPSLSNDPR
jgi:hypothetical protein